MHKITKKSLVEMLVKDEMNTILNDTGYGDHVYDMLKYGWCGYNKMKKAKLLKLCKERDLLQYG